MDDARLEKSLEYLSTIQDLQDLADYMDDPKFSEALDMAIKCIAKPDVPAAIAKSAVVQMQGWSFIFKMKAQVYMTIKKGEDNQKKNIYFTMADQCAGLSMALRPMAREAF